MLAGLTAAVFLLPDYLKRFQARERTRWPAMPVVRSHAPITLPHKQCARNATRAGPSSAS